MAFGKSKVELVAIKPMAIKTAKIRIVGDTSLIMHKWSEKAKKEILEKETKTTKTKAREKKSPAMEFIDSMYWISGKPDLSGTNTEDEKMDLYNKAIREGARFGFPATAIKNAAAAGAFRNKWAENQVSLKGTFFIQSDKDGLVEINYDEPPEMREDPVKIGMGADLRYRGMFTKWHSDLTIKYNENGQYTLDQIINFINAGGFSCGIGEWRPEKDGEFGMFHVELV